MIRVCIFNIVAFTGLDVSFQTMLKEHVAVGLIISLKNIRNTHTAEYFHCRFLKLLHRTQQMGRFCGNICAITWLQMKNLTSPFFQQSPKTNVDVPKTLVHRDSASEVYSHFPWT